MTSAVVIVLVAATLSVLGFVFLSKLVPERWLVADGDGANAVYAMIDMIYAVLLALGAIAVWEPRSEAASNTEREANDLVELYWSARVFAEPDKSEIQGLVIRYTEEVISGEWRSLREEQEPSSRAQTLMLELKSRVEAVRPADDQQTLSHDQALSRVHDAADARKTRVSAAQDGMPPAMWPILIIGGVISIAFLYLFRLDRTFPNGLMLFVVGGMIALILVVIYHLEYPFSRELAIEADAFLSALSDIRDLPK